MNLLESERHFDYVVDVMGNELVNNVMFRQYVIDRIKGYSYNYITLIKQADVKYFYKNSVKGVHKDVVWCTIELKLAVWLSKHYKDLRSEGQNEGTV